MSNAIYVAKSETVPSIPNVCRLCSAEDEENLIDLFNPQTPVLNFFRSVILYGTGLEIKEDDIVSKMVCQRCCEIAVKLHRYRSNALNNDKLLKAQYGIPQQSPTEASTESPFSLSNGHTKMEDETDSSLQSIINEKCEMKGVQQEPAKICKDVAPEPKPPRVIYKHPSVQKLYKSYPNLIVSQKIFSDDLSPVISLDESEVSDWYESQLEKMKKRLSHITIKKVANDDGSMGKCNGSSHDIVSPIPAVINNNSVLDRRPSTTSTCSKNDTLSSNDGIKSVQSKASDNLKSKKPTARKSTTTIEVNVPQENRKRSLSSCSGWSMDDHFDDALSTSNLSIHSKESDSDQPKKRPSLSSSLPEKKDMSRTSFDSKFDFLDDVFTDVKPHEKLLLKTEPNSSSHFKIDLANDLPTFKISSAMNLPNFSSNSKIGLPNNLPTEKINLLDRWKSPDESSSSQKQTPVIFQRARKRTAARVGSSATNKISKTDKVVKKKNKRYFNKDMLTDFKELDSTNRNHIESSFDSDTVSTIGVVAGRSTSDQDSLFVLTSGKTLAVFICAVCSLVCDTKRQLVDHEKTHLTCKFCKVRIKNLQLLIEHLNDTCIINVKKHDARIQLLRVDDNPAMVEKYKEAFQADTALYEDRDEDTKDEGINHDDTFSNDDFVPDLKEECDMSLIKHEEVKIEDTNENDINDIICLSDNEEEDGVEYSVIQRHTIVPEEEEEIHIDDELKIINRTDDNDIFLFDAMQRHHSSETEMIKTLFKKYYHGLIKFDKRCQTFRNTNRCVRRTSNNLILLERMLSELTVYIVAVSVESRPNITARFNTPQPPATRPLEYWGHKKNHMHSQTD
uniref:ZAD domain-containing protein n=1 Tax=Photinus pyralis TaxID=7054 RepID=A0A1Y1KZP1_PHOPY